MKHVQIKGETIMKVNVHCTIDMIQIFKENNNRNNDSINYYIIKPMCDEVKDIIIN